MISHDLSRLRGRAATQCSKKGSEKVLGRVLGRVLRRVLRRGATVGFTVQKGVLRRVLRRGSEKGVSRRCLERPLGEYAPLGVHPTFDSTSQSFFSFFGVSDKISSGQMGSYANGVGRI